MPLPAWDQEARTLTVALPKASTTQVPLSSYVEAADLPLLGVWAWVREALQELSEEVGPLPDGSGGARGRGVGRAGPGGTRPYRRALDAHARATLTLVHAVQQPLGRPALELEAARRGQDENAARLSGRLHVHGGASCSSTCRPGGPTG